MSPRFLTVGHACIDIVNHVDKIPSPDEKTASTGFHIQIGGNAANSAVAISHLGGHVDLCSVMGDKDSMWTIALLQMLSTSGVTVDCLFLESLPCSSSSILVLPNGDRAIASYQPNEITSAIHIPRDISKYQMVLGDTHRLNMVSKVFALANTTGVPTMLDVDKPIDDLQQLPQSGITFFSSESWRVFENKGMQLIDAHNVLGGMIGVTNGSRSIQYIDENGVWHECCPKPVTAINTLGAGDAWRAGLAVSLSVGMTIEQAIEQACHTAAEHIQEISLTRIIGESE